MLGCGSLLLFSACAKILGATDLTAASYTPTSFHEIRVGSARRNFLLHRPPPPYDHPMPLLVLLHGSSANANVMMRESGMNAIADSVRAIVVYPNGTGEIPYFRLFWNEFGCCARGAVHGVDEEKMLAAIVDTLSKDFPIDRTRVGLAGFSDPGSMAYLIACDQSNIWTVIAVVSGRLPKSDCAPARGVSTVVFHGTSDHNIRYAATDADVRAWSSREGCDFSASSDAPGVTITTFRGCKDNAEVKLYSIIGGKHGWPGGRRSSIFAPVPPRSVDASRVIVDFLLTHPRGN